MKDSTHYKTSTEDRIPVLQKTVYGLGALCNNLLAASLGCMTIVLNIGLGMNPALIGLILSISRFTDAFTDPIMGHVSDHTTSKWGRRRPYIFLGAILSGLVYAIIWQLPSGHTEQFYFWVFLLGVNIFYIANTLFATPFIALGYELTPDYHERTRLMGFSNFIGQFAWIAVPWFYMIMEHDAWFENSVQGAKGLAIAVGILVIVFGALPALFIKERYRSIAVKEEGAVIKGALTHMKEFLHNFLITIKFRPFLKLCAATFLVFNGFMVVSGFGSYVMIYYVSGGNQDVGAKCMGWFGTISSIATFCVIAFATWLSSKIGKRKAFFLTTGVSMVGYALKWFCYKPGSPYMLLIPAPLIAFGLGGLFTLVGAMMADVCDLDELKNGQRREGMFGAIYWWVVKLGMALAFAISGFLLNATGFDIKLGADQAVSTLYWLRVFDVGIPIFTSGLAIVAILFYEITEKRAHEIRAELEVRRGKVSAT